MVKIIADISPNSPTAYSSDRYRYRYGHGNKSSCRGSEETVYRRPVIKKKDPMPEIDKVRNNAKIHEDDEGGCVDYCIHIIANKFNMLDTICDKIESIMSKRPQIVEICKHDLRDEECEKRETRETREINQKSTNMEKEKEKEKEKREGIHKKLGKIVYHSRSGEIFVAEHSTQLHVYSDKHQNQITTQKVVWNDRIFQTKQDWFSEMAKLSIARADTNMQIVRCI